MTNLITDLIKLRNTLNQIEVRGENVKILSNCMFFLEQLVTDVQNGKYDSEGTVSGKEPCELEKE